MLEISYLTQLLWKFLRSYQIVDIKNKIKLYSLRLLSAWDEGLGFDFILTLDDSKHSGEHIEQDFVMLKQRAQYRVKHQPVSVADPC